jgi:hypothetical protein
MQNETALETDPNQPQSADLSQMWQEFDRRKGEWEQECLRIGAELEARRQTLDRQAAELEAHGIRLEERQTALAIREAALSGNELTPSNAEPGQAYDGQLSPDAQRAGETPTTAADPNQTDVSAAEPCNDEDIFARLRSYALLKPEAEVTPPAAENSIPEDDIIEPPPLLVGTQFSGEEPPVTGSDPEESVDDYMARLLNRIRGISAPAEVQPRARVEPRQVVAPQTETTSPTADKREPLVAVECPAPVAPDGSGQLVARTAPPELAVNLRAMRELANMTARGAIDKHTQGRWSKAAVSNTLLGIVSLACGAWLMLRATPLGSLAHAAGLIALVAGAFWVFQGASLFRTIRQVGRRTTKFVEAECHPASHEAPEFAHQSPEDALEEVASAQ